MSQDDLDTIRDDFVSLWGTFGTKWGINRTMAQIHALLMTSFEPLSTDDVMECLHISRGNAHTNLKELARWGLVHSVIKKGDRKEYFEAEKDVWVMFSRISERRCAEELDPALNALADTLERSKGLKGPEGKAFREQIQALHEFTELGSRVMKRVSRKSSTFLLSWAAKFLK